MKLRNFREKLNTCALFLVACMAGAFCSAPRKLDEPAYGLRHCQLYQSAGSAYELAQEVSKKTWTFGKFGCSGDLNDARIRLAGKSSLFKLRKSFRIKAIDQNLAFKSKKVLLSSQAADVSHMRSYLGAEVFRWLELPTFKQRPVAFYYNSTWMGLYSLIEPINSHFFRERDISVAQLFKAQFRSLKAANLRLDSLKNLEHGLEIKEGPKTYSKLAELIELIDAATRRKDDAELKEVLDIDDAIDYLVGASFLGHHDGYTNNYYLYLSEDGKFRFAPWDLDMVLDAPPRGPVYQTGTSLFGIGDNALLELIQAIPSLKSQYLRRLRQLASHFTVPEFQRLVEMYSEEIKQAYQADPRRSRYPTTFDQEKDRLLLSIERWLEPLNRDLEGFFP